MAGWLAARELGRSVHAGHLGAGAWVLGRNLVLPLWLLVDYLIFSAYSAPEPWSIALAVFIGVATIGVTVAFSLVSQPFAAHRAEAHGISRDAYLKRERVWAVVCIILAIVAVAWATYYNLEIRTV